MAKSKISSAKGKGANGKGKGKGKGRGQGGSSSKAGVSFPAMNQENRVSDWSKAQRNVTAKMSTRLQAFGLEGYPTRLLECVWMTVARRDVSRVSNVSEEIGGGEEERREGEDAGPMTSSTLPTPL